jgi:hypothetical protein
MASFRRLVTSKPGLPGFMFWEAIPRGRRSCDTSSVVELLPGLQTAYACGEAAIISKAAIAHDHFKNCRMPMASVLALSGSWLGRPD